MAALKIGVVEDELVIARTILHTLEELGYSHCGPAINYTEAIEMLGRDNPDLVLLDIQLSGKKDGIDVAEMINESYSVPFIFLTANSDGETIERAKGVRPHAYIVKPFNKEELFAAVEIAFNNFNAARGRAFMFVRDGYVFKKIYLSELLYLESEANYIQLHLKSQKKVMVRSTLNDFVAQSDLSSFIRIHRSYSVNMHLIDDVSPTEVSVQGVKVPVGKSYKENLFKILGISE